MIKNLLIIILVFITLKTGETKTYDDAFVLKDEGIVWVVKNDPNTKDLIIATFPEGEVSFISEEAQTISCNFCSKKY